MKAILVALVCALTVYGGFLAARHAKRVINDRIAVLVAGAQQ